MEEGERKSARARYAKTDKQKHTQPLPEAVWKDGPAGRQAGRQAGMQADREA